MKRVFLLRHGNAYDKDWSELPESPLNDNGLEHAKVLAKRLEGYKVDEVYCSTMQRAVDTCKEFIKLNPEVTPIYKDELREVVDEHFASDHDKLIYLKDTFEDIKNKVFHAFRDILEDSKGENIFMFTHGHWIRFVVLGVLNGSIDGFFSMNVDFASVTLLQVLENGNMRLELFNDSSHTKGLPHGCPWI